MAQTPEGKVKTWLRTKMKAWYPDAWHYCPPGGPFGKIGVHDDEWLIKAGDHCVYVAIEVKADKGVLSEPQKKNLFHIKSQGGVAALLVGKDETMLLRIKGVIDKKIEILETLQKLAKEQA